MPRSRAASSSEWSSDEIAALDQKAEALLAACPAPIDEPHCRRIWPVSYSEIVNGTLLREVATLNSALAMASSQLRSFLLVLRGLQGPSEEFEELWRSLSMDEVPASWQITPLGRMAASWFKALTARMHYFLLWAQDAAPTSVWLGAFTMPKSFLTSQQLEFGRRQCVSPDNVATRCYVVETVDGQPVLEPVFNDGCYLEGLVLSGASFDTVSHSITSCPLLRPEHPLPVVRWQLSRSTRGPVRTDCGEILALQAGPGLSCPVPMYHASPRERANFVAQMALPCQDTSWHLASVAVLLVGEQ